MGTFYLEEEDGWQSPFEQEAVRELRKRSFFKRFTEDEILPLLRKMKVRQHDFHSIIFPDDEVCIILDGSVESRFHENSLRIPKILGKYGAGHVLGFSEIDKGYSSHIETWNLCIS